MQNSKNYRISSLAKKDLQAIFDFSIKNWGEEQARHYALKLSSGFEIVSKSPNIGKSRNELFKKAMSFIVGKHIIFYCINEKLDTKIEISRVLHQSMDIELQFK